MAKKEAGDKSTEKSSAKKIDRKEFIAKAPIRRLMKQEGAELVAEDALLYAIELLTEKAKAVSKKALDLAQADKRKKVTAADIIEAARK